MATEMCKRPADPNALADDARRNRSRTDDPPPLLQTMHRGFWKDVASALPNAGKLGKFKVRFTDNTEKRNAAGEIQPVARGAFRRKLARQLPSAQQILTSAGVQGLPTFHFTQASMLEAAKDAGHGFFGCFQKPKLMWDWNADTAGLAAEDGRFVTVYVNEYISYPSLQEFLVFYDTVPAEVKCFYEMSRAGCTNKLFLDVDDESGGTDVNTLRAIIEKLCAYFSEVFGRTLDPGQFAITDSSRQKGSGYKNSYHGVDNSKFGFIVPAKGEHGDMKIFMLSFRAKFPGFADVVDKLVYTPNRPMRMIGSHKAQDPLFKSYTKQRIEKA